MQDISKLAIQTIHRSPEFKVKLGGVSEIALFDTGALHTCISQEWFEHNLKNLVCHNILPVSKTHVVNAIGSKSPVIKQQVLLTFTLAQSEFLVNCLIVKHLMKSIIIGMETMVKMNAIINTSLGTITFSVDNMKQPITLSYVNPDLKMSANGLNLANIDVKNDLNIDCSVEGKQNLLADRLSRYITDATDPQSNETLIATLVLTPTLRFQFRISCTSNDLIPDRDIFLTKLREINPLHKRTV
uniref:FERM domain-containing protein 8 n=1 Tax=Lygus hesperus TaxID=30085 RepID=A0A0A9Z7R7_LYGHE